MAIESCGLSCNVSDTVVTYSAISGEAPLWDEGDVVNYEIDQIDLQEHTDHTGNNFIRSGKNVKMVNVTLMLFPCSDWYKALYKAWCDNTLVCGDLVINDPCCDVTLVTKAGISQMAKKPVSHDSTAVDVVFRGILSC